MVDENTLGRQSVTIVEIDQDFCSRVYGVAPCTAAVGTTGFTKCFNTLATCQDTANFDKSSLTLRFCTPSPDFPAPGEFIIPSLVGITSNPTEITIGGSDKDSTPLGRRASVTITLRDHPYNDKLVDPYRSDRDYNPLDRGTFWNKWISRNPYHQNRPLRIREGYIGQAIEDMRTRNYIIEKVAGKWGNSSYFAYNGTGNIYAYYNRWKVLILDGKFKNWNTNYYKSEEDGRGNERFLKTKNLKLKNEKN